MSASREKKLRQERDADYVSPKQKREQAERRETRRATALFAVCAALFLAFVAYTWLNNSGALKRAADAAVVDGKTYSVSDVADYYYNARAGELHDNESLDQNTSLREQSYDEENDEEDEDGDYETWYAYTLNKSLDSLGYVKRVAQEARKAGFNGGDKAQESFNETMDSLKSAASERGYPLDNYISAVFDGLMTRRGFEKALHEATLAETYVNSRNDPSGYTEAELEAVRDGGDNTCYVVSYESAIYQASNYETEGEEDSDKARAAAKAAAESALARIRSGKVFRTIARYTNADYADAHAYYSDSSEIAKWLFDDARQKGDTTVLDYTYYGANMGSVVLKFYGKTLADFHPVSVRHILVEDRETAEGLLKEYRTGEQTEDAFAALATEHSTDPGSAENGGLYENIYLGQMVAPFEAWCFDASRATGDTGIVASEHGYHVMYFVSRGEYPYWQTLAVNKLAADWAEAQPEKSETKLLDGLKYIDP